MKGNPIIQIEDIKKVFNGNVGVKGIHFNVYEGEIFGFLGPNGAGKTTAIKMMLDIIKPESGVIKIFGKSVIENSIFIRENVGYLPGDFKALDGLTGKEFLKISAKIKQTTYDIDPLLEQLQLDKEALNRKVRTYSQGMKQKLGIINALAANPKLLILDEPSSGLDPIIQFALYDLLKKMANNGTTILFSSHNLPEVERICDRVAVIKNGKLAVVANIAELKSKSVKKIYLKLKKPIEELNINGADIIDFKNDQYTLKVNGNINDVISAIDKLEIEDIIIPRPSLDEIFKSFYESKN